MSYEHFEYSKASLLNQHVLVLALRRQKERETTSLYSIPYIRKVKESTTKTPKMKQLGIEVDRP